MECLDLEQEKKYLARIEQLKVGDWIKDTQGRTWRIIERPGLKLYRTLYVVECFEEIPEDGYFWRLPLAQKYLSWGSDNLTSHFARKTRASKKAKEIFLRNIVKAEFDIDPTWWEPKLLYQKGVKNAR